MHYYQFNIADYRKDTVHLSRLEHSIYRDLIDWYYLDEQPIPSETQVVSRRLRLVSQDEANALQNVLSDFFVATEDGFRHPRIDQDIAEYHAQCEKNRLNGKKGGRPPGAGKRKKTQSVSTGLPVDTESQPTRNPNQEPITNNQLPPKPPAGDVRFERFWSYYPKKVGKDAAHRAFLRRKVDDNLLNQMLQAMSLQASSEQWQRNGGQYIPNPATWINQGRWQDGQAAQTTNSLGVNYV